MQRLTSFDRVCCPKAMMACHALATITEDGFAVLDRALLNPMGEKKYSTDTALREEQVKNDLAAACITKDRRPSVETSLHNCMEAAYVVHLHPTLVNGLMCSANAAETCAELFPDALYIAYTDPGYTLFKKVYDKIASYKKEHGREPQVIFLQNHGIFVGADSTEEIERIYDDVLSRIGARTAALPEGPAAVCDCVSETIPAVRTYLSRGGRGLKTLRVTNNALIESFVSSKEAVQAVMKPFTPDGIVYCKSEYIYIDPKDEADLLSQAEKKIEAYCAKRGHTPKVILIKGIGLVAVGDNSKNAQVITDVFTDAMKVAFYAGSFGGPHPMNKRQIDFIDNWEVENYRRKVAASGSVGRVEGKTIIVTGAAQGFGEGIARELLKQGANIVVADLNEVTGEKTAAGFNAIAGNNKAIFVKTNVADMDSLRNLVKVTVMTFGALDVFVSNAGVVRGHDSRELRVRHLHQLQGLFLLRKGGQPRDEGPDRSGSGVFRRHRPGQFQERTCREQGEFRLCRRQVRRNRAHPVLRARARSLQDQVQRHLPWQLL